MQDNIYIIWALIIGLVAAAIYSFYIKRALGGFIQKLFDLDAFDEESAVSLEEIGYDKNILVKHSLREGSNFSETVYNHNGKYYIPHRFIERAENKYKNEGASILVLVTTVIVFILIAIVVTYFAPKISEIINGLFNN
ncbi:hypothetical protein LJB90_01985 [Eubacteriales bacterium OttesenSCG-928-G02]|nr:hypothetical protein [Eubacteriales bacterium OttesenSCG-928-G02]